MNLNNLPKDMLIKMISRIEEEKEKEFSEFVVVPYDQDEVQTRYFKNEMALKKFLIIFLYARSKIYTENLKKVEEDEDEYWRIIGTLNDKYTLSELFQLVKNFRKENKFQSFTIIKGKKIC